MRRELAGVSLRARGPKGVNAAISLAFTSLGMLVSRDVSLSPSLRAASFTLMLSLGHPPRLCSLHIAFE